MDRPRLTSTASANSGCSTGTGSRKDTCCSSVATVNCSLEKSTTALAHTASSMAAATPSSATPESLDLQNPLPTWNRSFSEPRRLSSSSHSTSLPCSSCTAGFRPLSYDAPSTAAALAALTSAISNQDAVWNGALGEGKQEQEDDVIAAKDKELTASRSETAAALERLRQIEIPLGEALGLPLLVRDECACVIDVEKVHAERARTGNRAAREMERVSVFAVAAALQAAQVDAQGAVPAAVEQEQQARRAHGADREENEHESELGRASCALCGQERFDGGVAEQRLHFRTDWHRLNVRRRAAGKPALGEAEAEQVLEDAASDLESLSGSDDQDEDQEEHGAPEQGPAGFVKEANSMLVGVSMADGTGVVWAPKAVVLDKAREAVSAHEFVERPLWVVLLHSAGHFAGVVLERGETVVASKSFHRYVIRAKQGKAQSANDNQNGKAKSAGAHIRRQNEQMLKDEIRDLLIKWDKLGYFARCSRVFEATQVGQRLAIAEVEPQEAFDARVAEQDALNKQRVEAAAAAAAASAPVAPQPGHGPSLVQLLDACSSGDLGEILLLLATAPQELNVRSLTRQGVTALHTAALSGHAEVVKTLLDQGANPELRDFRGRLAYNCAVESKPCRDAFRVFRGEHPDKWDYDATAIPDAITEDSVQLKKQKQREKKKRQAARKKLAKQQERERQEEAARREAEEAARILANAPTCGSCGNKLAGKPKDWFSRGDWHYCSQACLQTHRRALAAAAAEARFKKR
ncbi:Ankyrin repeat and zinc finger domain-containing protein 1 [Durusdinium trenchii]|uniref:Ankyrin repeat and zinc finger domain-containing protein 1 n=1 Tax=Durusdinium trenchii TaxID=1381693 RepID=A0ABP0S6Y0_9DINO